MNTMNMPGFTAENSTYKTNNHFQSKVARSFGSGKNDNQVYMQKPRIDNTPGGKCHATTSNGTSTVYIGTYDSNGDCCGPTLCINCDNGTCGDGHTQPGRVLDRFKFANFQRGIFARV
jgi:hypothetical protein